MTEKVTWGVPSFWIERFPLYYGRHTGIFLDHGIDLEIWYSWGGPELVRAVERGDIWIGEMGLLPFSRAFAQGFPAQVVGSSTIQQLDHYLVGVPEVGGIDGLADRNVGVLSRGSCDDYFLRYILERNGMDSEKDVAIVPLGDSYGKLDCFTSRLVDAGFLVEPYVSLGEHEKSIRVLTSVKSYFPRYQWGIIFARNDALEQRRATVTRVLEAFRASSCALRDNLEEAVKFGAQVFRLKKEIFRTALLRDLDNWEFDLRLDMKGMENCIRIQQELGAVPPGVTAASMVWKSAKEKRP